MTDYKLLAEQSRSLISGEPYLTADLANISALIYNSLADLNWAGFYLVNNDKLILGPFQGKPACIEIPLGRGVCGTAVAENRTQLVPDVSLFPGHIACDCDSKSEIVVPIRASGRVVAVLDIDSPVLSRFDEDDKEGLESIAAIIESELATLFVQE